jgi:hypothetical protein
MLHFLAALALPALVGASSAPLPKVIITAFIDDFGYASASFNRDAARAPPETLTPHLDALARDGVVLRRFYAHPFCSPSRASFMSGRLPLHVQQANTQPDQPNCGVPFNMTTLPEFLRAAGQAPRAGIWRRAAPYQQHRIRAQNNDADAHDGALRIFPAHPPDFGVGGTMLRPGMPFNGSAAGSGALPASPGAG